MISRRAPLLAAGILALLTVVAAVAYFDADVAGTQEAGAPADPAGVPDDEPVARVAAQV